jgi:hypothetical protein
VQNRLGALRLRVPAVLALLPAAGLLPALFAACTGTPASTALPAADLDGGPTGEDAATPEGGADGQVTGEDAGDPFTFAANLPHSCAFKCPSSSCKESTTPYGCPMLEPWGQIPHDTPCGTWDGGFPAVTGACTATAPSGAAIAYTQKAGTPTILPDGRRVTPAGHDWLFDEADVPQSIPTSAIAVPGTTFLLVVDEAYGTNDAVRVVDTSKIDGTTNPTVSHVIFANPLTINRGIAFVPPGEVYVSSDDGVVHALTLNTTTGALALDDTAHALTTPGSVNDQGNPANYYAQGVAASPDGTRLVVTSVLDSHMLVFDVKPTSATFGKQVGELGLGAPETWGAWFDPHDATGQYVYVSDLQNDQVLEVDVSTPTAPTIKATYPTDKNPQSIAFLDGRWMAVATAFGDAIDIIDRTTTTVTSVPVSLEGDGLHGADPSTLAYDATNARLYATLAGANAIEAWSVDLSTTPPTLASLGELPTAWWPSDVVVLSDGSLVVPNLKGHGNGPNAISVPPDDGDGMAGASGGIQKIPAPSTSDLSTGATAVFADDDVSQLAGHSVVDCPDGGAYDFPIPATNTGSPSSRISHVVFIVRENKAYDGVFGDLDAGNGDPSLTSKTTPAGLDKLWPNLRDVARQFAFSDNYYTDAELSVQGHMWTTYARTNDYCEREWIDEGYARSPFASPAPAAGTASFGQPAEGSIFDWLGKNQVPYRILGEGDGLPQVVAGQADPVDVHYPGGPVQSINYPDNEKACYFAGRERVLCDLGNVTYMTLPNDHCSGVSPNTPSPETMIATNDEATGMVIDAVSHSPLWASTLVIVTEDDPQQGGDHVDHHRTPIIFASPWLNHGYATHTHMDVASIAKLVAHIFAIPYPNALVARAGMPFDLFTGTPDYTPYTYTPRQEPLTCGQNATQSEINLTESYDFSDVDQQPGLDDMVSRWLRSDRVKIGQPPLPKRIEAAKVTTTERATATKR